MMLVRLLFFAVLVGAGVAFWRFLQPDKRLQIPAAWTQAAKTAPWLGEAIELRQKIAKQIITSGKKTSGAELLQDVDEVMARLVKIADVEDHAEELSSEVGDRLSGSVGRLLAERDEALAWLTEAYAVLIESAASDFDASAARLHKGLESRKEELRHEVEARREINEALDRTGARPRQTQGQS